MLIRNYVKQPIGIQINVSEIVTIHYFEFAKDFYFPGESHDFWELVYIDKGEIIVKTDNETILLKQGDIFFHKPMELHGLKANGVIAPNVYILSFVCDSPDMNFFLDNQIKLNSKYAKLLGKIMEEGMNAFEPPYDDVNTMYMIPKSNSPFASMQMMKLYLEQFLITLIRNLGISHKSTYSFTENIQNDTVQDIIIFLEENINSSISIDEICNKFNAGKTTLSNMFKNVTGYSIKDYFIKLKISRAKQMIREEKYNFTQIADILGFKSLHYFSHRFKLSTSMSPSEYSLSVKAKLKI